MTAILALKNLMGIAQNVISLWRKRLLITDYTYAQYVRVKARQRINRYFHSSLMK
jgi:hypothetical protein